MQTKNLTIWKNCKTNPSETVNYKAKPSMKKNTKPGKKPKKKYDLIAFRPAKEVRQILPKDPKNLSSLINEVLKRRLAEVVDELEQERIAREKLAERIAQQSGGKGKG